MVSASYVCGRVLEAEKGMRHQVLVASHKSVVLQCFLLKAFEKGNLINGTRLMAHAGNCWEVLAVFGCFL